MKRASAVVVTCEHASAHVPVQDRWLFVGREALLDSHQAWDPGALPLARALARALGAPLFHGRVTRLLVDLNRSAGNPRLWSSFARQLEPSRRRQLLEQYYVPYRAAVKAAIDPSVSSGQRVVHLSVHSFTPVLDGRVRTADVGLLYDPARSRERSVAGTLETEIRKAHSELRVRRNYPYRGTSDGHTTSLRRAYAKARYLGIEIEVNQAFWPEKWTVVQHAVIRAVLSALLGSSR